MCATASLYYKGIHNILHNREEGSHFRGKHFFFRNSLWAESFQYTYSCCNMTTVHAETQVPTLFLLEWFMFVFCLIFSFHEFIIHSFSTASYLHKHVELPSPYDHTLWMGYVGPGAQVVFKGNECNLHCTIYVCDCTVQNRCYNFDVLCESCVYMVS